MSRGFVKEAEEIPEPVVVDALRARPITAAGFAELEQLLVVTNDPQLRAKLQLRLANAVVSPLPADCSRCSFGATVVVSGLGNSDRRFTIVGEDEIDVERGRIGADAPFAVALQGAGCGETVVWHRPAGDTTLTIRSVTYDA